MWYLIDDGNVFEGDEVHLDDVFGVTPEGVKDFCTSQGFSLRTFETKEEAKPFSVWENITIGDIMDTPMKN